MAGNLTLAGGNATEGSGGSIFIQSGTGKTRTGSIHILTPDILESRMESQHGASGDQTFKTGNSDKGRSGSFIFATGSSTSSISGGIFFRVGQSMKDGGNLAFSAGHSQNGRGGDIAFISGASYGSVSGSYTFESSQGSHSGGFEFISGEATNGNSGGLSIRTGNLHGSKYQKNRAGSITAEVGDGNAGDGGDIAFVSGNTSADGASGGLGMIISCFLSKFVDKY